MPASHCTIVRLFPDILMKVNKSGVDSEAEPGLSWDMIEIGSLIFGLCFSVLVFFRSIKRAELTLVQKAFYFIISLIGITGTVFLSGVLIADALRKLHVL